MSHDQHVLDGVNSDAQLYPGCNYEDARSYYLDLASDWKPLCPDPMVVVHDGVRVVRDDLVGGTKMRSADLLLSTVPEKKVVYSQMRVGLAGPSLVKAAKHHSKETVLFMPACKRISLHQACCIEAGAVPRFERIAATRNLNMLARKWSEENGAFFIPFGLKHRLATAAIVRAAAYIDPPEEAWLVISTGVLTRALQIAWPKTEFHVVAVARNMKAGETGRVAEVISEPLDFTVPERSGNLPPFPSVSTYDAKAWKYVPKDGTRDRLFWNVGCEPTLRDETIYDRTDSYRDWKGKKHE